MLEGIGLRPLEAMVGIAGETATRPVVVPTGMPVDIVCSNCGREHRIPDRRFDADSGGTSCPDCGAVSYGVRRDGLEWHTER